MKKQSEFYLGHLREANERAKHELFRGTITDFSYPTRKREREEREKPSLPTVPLETRYEGIYVNGRPGRGKTQLLQHLLLPDLDMVAAGKAVLVIIDPTDDLGGDKPTLIRLLTRLKRFAPAGDLHGKLVYINPADEDYYLPVNLFNMRPTEQSARAISAVINNYVQIMDGVLGQPLTDFQAPVFKWAVQIALGFPNPSLETMLDVLAPTPEGERPIYEEVFDQLDPDVQRYIRRTYNTQRRISSREDILSRLESLNADPQFRQMFNGKRTSVDFRKLINEPNVIVINLPSDLGDMRRLYTRYYMAQLYHAGEHRPENPLPCFIYIDECDLIVDDSVGEMIRRLRKKNVGLTLANQQTDRLSEDAREAVTGVAVKFANSYEESAKDIGRDMGLKDGSGRVNTSLLTNRPAFNFAVHTIGMQELESYIFEPFEMNKQPAMTEEEWRQVRQQIRSRFYEPVPHYAGAEEDQITEPEPEISAAAPSASPRQKRPYPPRRRPKAGEWTPPG